MEGVGAQAGQPAGSREVADTGAPGQASGEKPVTGSQQPGGSHQLTGSWQKRRLSKSAQST